MVTTILEKFKEKLDTDTSFLFVDAIEKLDKIDVQAKDSKKQIGVKANESKKQIVRELAKSLEGEIPTDTICIELTNRLRGRVSDRFIRQCLDEKYKQKGRVKNAKKQKNHEKKDKAIDKLAAVTPLNPAFEEEKGIVDAGDKISIEEVKDEPPIIDFSVMTEKTIVPVSYQQEHKLKEKTNPG
jgi:NCAIR mutase (PurE)-related protein